MPIDAKTPESAEKSVAAKERVRIGPVPTWATSCPFDSGFKPRRSEQVTYLLISQQAHAEKRQVHFESAVRLETMQAVQHQSQWRFQFEPRSQTVTLHWIRIRRGESLFEHANLEKLRFLQRAEGLEGFVIDGWFTILLVLDDVRPGDVLESCYTVESRFTLMPENYAFLFGLPQRIPVGKFRYSLTFGESRPMKWKSSSPTLTPVESRENGETLWTWTGENNLWPELEVSVPEWHITAPWIQVSDCPDWAGVAVAVAQTWQKMEDDTLLEEIAKGFIVEEPALQGLEDKDAELLLRVEKALRFVQDEFRYLSVDLEVGGHVPAPPEMVARRRFGDCKDLSFLLVHLLEFLGVSARPVLVNTRLRKFVGEMLPMAGLFNHVVVEYKIGGETRWVDATLKHQGGGPLNRVIADYGFGLPISDESSGLVEARRPFPEASLYELKESLLLDTTGKGSLLAVVLTAKGIHAEMMRQHFEAKGKDEFSKERLQLCANRFRNAARFGPLKHRDDRLANEFVLAEVFEVNGFLEKYGRPGTCRLLLPNNLVVSTLPWPEKESRQNPFALPHPCNLVHIIEIQSPALPLINLESHKIESPFVRFNCSHRNEKGFWSVTLRLCTLVDSVPPDRMGIYKRTVEEIRQKSTWHVLVGTGHSSPRKGSDFGELPSLPRQSSTDTTSAKPKLTNTVGASEHAAIRVSPFASASDQVKIHGSSSQSRRSEYRHEREYGRRQRRRWRGRRLLWPAVIAIALAVIVIFICAVRQSSR